MAGYYRRSVGVASRVVEGEAVLVKMPEGVLHVLNPSASRLWVMADGVRPVAELAELAGRAGGADVEEARAFLARCVELGLMELSDRPRAEADVYPQEVAAVEEVEEAKEAELAAPVAPPAVRATEPVETLAGPSCALTEFGCTPPST